METERPARARPEFRDDRLRTWCHCKATLHPGSVQQGDQAFNQQSRVHRLPHWFQIQLAHQAGAQILLFLFQHKHQISILPVLRKGDETLERVINSAELRSWSVLQGNYLIRRSWLNYRTVMTRRKSKLDRSPWIIGTAFIVIFCVST